jgi:hypothetical protein
MMRKWRTDLFRYGLRMTYDFAIPTPGVRLWAHWRHLDSLEEDLKQPFVFTLKPTDVTDTTWQSLSATFGVALDPPLDPQQTLIISRTFEANKDGDSVFEFVAPDGYTVTKQARFILQYSGPAGVPSLLMSSQFPMTGHVTVPGTGIFEGGVEGIGGGERAAVTIRADLNYRIQVVVSTTANRRPEIMEAWQLKSWETLRQASFAAHEARLGRLREERDILYRQLAARDTLSLRRLEREEMMRMILMWLVGLSVSPGAELAPPIIDAMLEAILENEMEHLNPQAPPTPTFSGMSSSDQGRLLGFGEVVKFLQQAIEWENLLYFFYPYYWGSETQSRERLLFEHPDPEHQNFLRAGYARVVITVRPGFERTLTALLETGSMGGGGSPYMTIAEEIANFARTNYTGIPPANPEQHARPQLYPQQRKTWDVMQGVMQAIEAHRASTGSYPPNLGALPGALNKKDAWGRDLVYLMPGSGNDYDLLSYGADGVVGGEGLNADISSSAGASLIASWFDYTPTSGLDIVVDTKIEDIA